MGVLREVFSSLVPRPPWVSMGTRVHLNEMAISSREWFEAASTDIKGTFRLLLFCTRAMYVVHVYGTCTDIRVSSTFTHVIIIMHACTFMSHTETIPEIC